MVECACDRQLIRGELQDARQLRIYQFEVAGTKCRFHETQRRRGELIASRRTSSTTPPPPALVSVSHTSPPYPRAARRGGRRGRPRLDRVGVRTHALKRRAGKPRRPLPHIAVERIDWRPCVGPPEAARVLMQLIGDDRVVGQEVSEALETSTRLRHLRRFKVRDVVCIVPQYGTLLIRDLDEARSECRLDSRSGCLKVDREPHRFAGNRRDVRTPRVVGDPDCLLGPQEPRLPRPLPRKVPTAVPAIQDSTPRDQRGPDAGQENRTRTASASIGIRGRRARCRKDGFD